MHEGDDAVFPFRVCSSGDGGVGEHDFESFFRVSEGLGAAGLWMLC
jgi:hypothetical protein